MRMWRWGWGWDDGDVEEMRCGMKLSWTCTYQLVVGIEVSRRQRAVETERHAGRAYLTAATIPVRSRPWCSNIYSFIRSYVYKKRKEKKRNTSRHIEISPPDVIRTRNLGSREPNPGVMPCHGRVKTPAMMCDLFAKSRPVPKQPTNSTPPNTPTPMCTEPSLFPRPSQARQCQITTPLSMATAIGNSTLFFVLAQTHVIPSSSTSSSACATFTDVYGAVWPLLFGPSPDEASLPNSAFSAAARRSYMLLTWLPGVHGLGQ